MHLMHAAFVWLKIVYCVVYNGTLRVVGACVWHGLQMFGSVSSVLRVDVDDAVRERDCNSVCTDHCRELKKTHC